MYYGYAIAVNPAAAYASQYQAYLLQELNKQIGEIRLEAQKDDFQRAHECLIKGDFEKAIRYFEKEAHLGVSQAAKALGDLYHFKIPDLEKSIFFYKRAFELGDLESSILIDVAKYHLGQISANDINNDNQYISSPWQIYLKSSLNFESWKNSPNQKNDSLEKILEEINSIDIEEFPHLQLLTAEILLKKNQVDRAEQMLIRSANQGFQQAITRLTQIKIDQDKISEAAVDLIGWESKFNWNKVEPYSLNSLLRVFLFMPSSPAGKSDLTKQIANLASMMWAGGKIFRTAWDVYETEISRSEHGLKGGTWGPILLEDYRESGKKPQSLVYRISSRLITGIQESDNWKNLPLSEEEGNWRHLRSSKLSSKKSIPMGKI